MFNKPLLGEFFFRSERNLIYMTNNLSSMKKIFKINEEGLKPIGPRDPRILGTPRSRVILVNSGYWSSEIRPCYGRM